MTENSEDRCPECGCKLSWLEIEKKNLEYLKFTKPRSGEEGMPSYMRYLLRIGAIDGYNQGPPERSPNSSYQSLVEFVRSIPEHSGDTEQN